MAKKSTCKVSQGEAPTPPSISNFQTPAISTEHLGDRKRLISMRPSNTLSSLSYAPLLISLLGLLISGYAAFQTTRSANAAKDSAIASLENVRIGQRAYLDVKNMTLDPVSAGQKVIVQVRIENSGHTPALNTSIQSKLDYREDTIIPESPDYGIPDSEISLVTIASGVSYRNILIGKRTLLKEEVEALNNQKARFYVYGFIKYDDVFGCHYTTKFCGWYDFERKGFNFCGTHNSIQ